MLASKRIKSARPAVVQITKGANAVDNEKGKGCAGRSGLLLFAILALAGAAALLFTLSMMDGSKTKSIEPMGASTPHDPPAQGAKQ